MPAPPDKRESDIATIQDWLPSPSSDPMAWEAWNALERVKGALEAMLYRYAPTCRCEHCQDANTEWYAGASAAGWEYRSLPVGSQHRTTGT